MMRQMRENTKWIMLVTALAFVALMVFEWGMDATGRTAGGVGEIGRVNGSPVMHETYQSAYRQLYDQAQASQEQPLTSQDVRNLEDAAFDQVVNQLLIQEELKRRGIEVSADEIRQAARFNPPPEVRQIFQGADGFDLQQYQQYLASPNADPQILQYIEAYFRDRIPRAKLLRQISSGLYLTDQELWQRWKDQNETVEVRYVAMDPSARIPDSEVQLSDEELETYYEENQEEFEVPARATLKAVVLPKTPTPGDTAASRDRAERVADELREGADWGEVAAIESDDDATASEGGDLGVVTPGQMVPAFDSAAFGGPVGEIQGPVRTNYGWHILEVQERWDRDSAQARHVLVSIARTDSSEIHLLTMADSLEDLGERVTLAEAARILDEELIDARITEDFAVIPGAGQVGEAADWAFEEASPGDVSPVFESSQAFYAVELVESSPAGVLPFEEARGPIREILVARKKLARAEEEAAELVDRVRSGTPLPDVAADAGLQVGSAGPFARNDFVPGIGRQNAAVGAAFGLDVGEVSEPIATENNVFVLEKLSQTPADSAQWIRQREAQREQVMSRMQQQRLQDWLAGMRASARIVDRRSEVLQDPGEQTEQPRPGGGLGF